MKVVTKEQIAMEKQIDLLSYLKAYEPQELVKVGHEYKTRTHDSLRISENEKWNWCNQGFGGTTALGERATLRPYFFFAGKNSTKETAKKDFDCFLPRL